MTDEIKEELNQKLSDLGRFFTKHKMPMFLIYADESAKDGTEYGNYVLTPFELGIELTDDRITKYSASLNKYFTIKLSNNLIPEDRTGDAIDELIGEYPGDE